MGRLVTGIFLIYFSILFSYYVRFYFIVMYLLKCCSKRNSILVGLWICCIDFFVAIDSLDCCTFFNCDGLLQLYDFFFFLASVSDQCCSY